MKRETGQRKISSFLVGEAFDERLMKNYPTDFQTLTYTYHQIISLSRIISPYGKMRQTRQEKRMSRQGKKNRQRQNLPMVHADRNGNAAGRVIRKAEEAHGTAMHDRADAGAGTGIFHRRKIP